MRSGIGLAAAKAFARLGLRLCIADLGEERVANESQVAGTLPSFASSFSCRAITAIRELRHDVIHDGGALTPSETIS